VAFNPALRGEDFCYLTTTGRRTGDPHTIEIWFGMPDDGRAVYLLSGGGDRSDWVRNLVANPAVGVRFGAPRATDVPGHARLVEAADEEEAARRLLAAKYQGWDEGRPLSSWARTALCVAVDPD
jgi:deazaflavin-dependent oxidoreductase (nitroreductase family)